MSDLVYEVVDDIRKTSEKHKIVLKNGIRGRVVGDKDRLSQVLINLLTNAIKYSPKSDKVIVEAHDTRNEVVVSVKDRGIGINKDEQDKIFDRFYRVRDSNDKTFPGLGIGLYISKEIIERHNGRIWLESQKGRGSTFYFSLPKS